MIGYHGIILLAQFYWDVLYVLATPLVCINIKERGESFGCREISSRLIKEIKKKFFYRNLWLTAQQAQRYKGIKSDALAAPFRVQKHVHVN